MKKELSQNWNIYQSWLRFLVIILLVIGVFFRFANIDKKTLLGRRSFLSLRISGYMQSENE